MLSLKVEGQGYLDIQPENIVAFEEIKEKILEARPAAKCGVFYDIGEGLTTVIVENSYDVVKSAAKRNLVEVTAVNGTNVRRMSYPRDSVIYREDIIYKEPEEPAEGEDKVEPDENRPNTLIKINISGQIISIATKEDRGQLDLI